MDNNSDPYEHYTNMWLSTGGNVLVLVDQFKHMYLFDAVLLGSWGMLSQASNANVLMYQLYPCGLLFVGDFLDSNRFDQSFAQKRSGDHASEIIYGAHVAGRSGIAHET